MPAPDHESKLDVFLQEFAHEIGIICALEAGGKIDSKEAYTQIKAKWKNLKSKKKELFPKIERAG